jgi:hypothetical protein
MEICTCHYDENLDWLLQSEFPVTVIHKEGGTPIEYTHCIPNVGAEASAYLKFINERYDTLPEYTAFLHGHENSYHHKGDRPILDMIRTANVKKYDVIHLNNTYRCTTSQTQLNMFEEECKTLNIQFPEFFVIDCCAQFIVSKKAIQRNTKEYYMSLSNLVETKIQAVFLEHIWHYVFTGEFNVFPMTDYFDPPLKEIMYATGSSMPFYVKDIKICYVGQTLPPAQFHHITNKEQYEYYAWRGAIFIKLKGDDFSYKPDDIGRIVHLENYQFGSFLHNYIQHVKIFENIILQKNKIV